MKSIILKTLLVLAVVAMGVLSISVKPKKAQCAWCPSYTCYGANSCGYGCSCVTTGGQAGGQCVSIQ